MAERNPFARLFSAEPAGYTITLANVAPGKHNDDLEISLVQVDPKKTVYDCISYDRSSLQDIAKITVDGGQTVIPLPLEQALRCLRRKNTSILVWADVLAGDSVEERNRGAVVKRAIMQRSRKVVCFLGTGNKRSSEVFVILNTLAAWWLDGSLLAFASTVPGIVSCNPEVLRKWLVSREYSKIRLSDTDLWNGIHEVLSSPYFGTPQAISDVVLGKKTILRSGSGSLRWRDFYVAFMAYIYLSPELKVALPRSVLDTFDLITSIELAVQRRLLQKPLELLFKFRCDVTACPGRVPDPREVVFAMLPIAEPSKKVEELGNEPEPLPTVDYRKSIIEVFTEAARYVLHERQDMMLWHHQSAPCRRRIHGLPTWACDFSTPAPNESDLGRIRCGFRDWSNSVTPKKRIFVDSESNLHVQAHAMDRVEFVSEILNESNCRRLITDTYLSVPKADKQSAHERIDKFWRALILDPPPDAGELLRDANHRDDQLKWSFLSLLAEECILKGLDCTPKELSTNSELQEKTKTTRVVLAFGKLTGKSELFEMIFKRNSLGRRIFTTAVGRVGMTAIEAPSPSLPTTDSPEPQDGQSPEPHEEAHSDHPEECTMLGVSHGDIVVALVGGVFPYILRPLDSEAHVDNANMAILNENASYSLVGECHLQGAMTGELFKDPDDLYGGWKSEITLVDILIV